MTSSSGKSATVPVVGLSSNSTSMNFANSNPWPVSNNSLLKKRPTQHSSGVQPQLMVLLDNNYGLPSGDKTQTKKPDTNIASVSSSPNVASKSVKSVVINQNMPKQILNGANSSNSRLFKPQENSTSRCRSCLITHPSRICRNITLSCYMDKTIKDAILRIIPKVNVPLQETDVVCNTCFETLKQSLALAYVFARSEKVLEFELHNKHNAIENSLNGLPEYTPLGDTKLDLADKIISLSKMDNNNLASFVGTLQSNQVKIFQVEPKKSSSRKRVLLLGNPKWHFCHICSAKYISDNLLQDHINTEHLEELILQEAVFKCKVCNQTFDSKSILNEHSKLCVIFACPHCAGSKVFPSSQLLEHTQIFHDDKFPFKCSKCKQEFDEYALYRKHDCTGFSCKKCGKTFQSKPVLANHINKYKDVPCSVPSSTCTICKEIVLKKNYPSHISEHLKFVCSKCDMKFLNNEDLKRHGNKHLQSLQTHRCPDCGKAFLKAESLVKHKETHKLTKTKEEVCEETHKLTKTKEETDKLTKTKEETDKLAKTKEETDKLTKTKEEVCEICNDKFDSIESLKEHITKSHGDPDVTCELCGEECEPEKLKQHIELKHGSAPEHHCPLCSRTFTQDIQYKRHMEIHIHGKIISKFDRKKSVGDSANQDDDEEQLFESSVTQESTTDPPGETLMEESIEEEITEILESEEPINSKSNNIEKSEVENIRSKDGNVYKKRKLFNFAVNVPSGPILCKYCLKTFNDDRQLMKHIQTHFQSKKNEKCSHCDLKFYTKTSRIKHERSHSASVYKFRCNICWRLMQNQEDLDNHTKTHSNILNCPECSEKFAHQWQLDKHNSKRHVKRTSDNDSSIGT